MAWAPGREIEPTVEGKPHSKPPGREYSLPSNHRTFCRNPDEARSPPVPLGDPEGHERPSWTPLSRRLRDSEITIQVIRV